MKRLKLLLATAKFEWDRLAIYALFMAFGVHSVTYPIVSFEKSAPHWAEIALGVEFFIAGVCLIVGVHPRRRGYRMAGLVVVALGLFTISLIIALSGGTRVLAYAFLFGAFAVDSIHDIRREKRKQQEAPDALRRELQDILEMDSARPERTEP